MELMMVFIFLAVIIGLYVWGYRVFKRKHAPETAGPLGQRPYGVHGWLAFFIFASYYIAPLFSLSSLNNNFMTAERDYPDLLTLQGYQSYKGMLFTITIALVVTQIMVAMRLRWKLEPQSLKNARVFCFAAPVGIIAADIVLGNVFLDVIPDPKTIMSYIGSLLASSIWGLYFLFSRRCKNTYLGTVHDDGAADMTASAQSIQDKAQAQAQAQAQGTDPQNSPSPVPESRPSQPAHHEGIDVAQRLNKLNELKSAGLLTDDEYDAKRRDILSSI